MSDYLNKRDIHTPVRRKELDERCLGEGSSEEVIEMVAKVPSRLLTDHGPRAASS